LWELKGSDIPYLFIGHNCATLIYDILKIGYLDTLKDIKGWATTIAVVRALRESDLLGAIRLYEDDKWRYNMLNEQVDIQRLIGNKSALGLFAKLREKTKRKIENRTLSIDKNDEIVFDLSHYKSPLGGYKERMVEVGYSNKKRFFRFMPASHRVAENRGNYFSLSSLELFSGLFTVDKSGVRLKHFSLYKAYSYMPYLLATKELSGGFELGYRDDGRKRYFFKIERGVTFSYISRFYAYLLGGVEVGLSSCLPIIWRH